MSQHAAELCTLLVDEIYGELSSRVFSILLRLGRLNLPALLPHVRLPPRQLKNALAVLIQQHLVLHFTSPNDEKTYYEADWHSAFCLVRAGKVIELAQEHLGESAAELISNLLLQGHATIGDLVEAYSKALGVSQNMAKTSLDRHRESTSSTNGNQHLVTTLQQLHRTLRRLLSGGFVIPVRREQLRPLADSFNEAERLLKIGRGNVGVTGTKAKQELNKQIVQQVKNGRDGRDENGMDIRGIKRALSSDDDDMPTKRSRLLAGHSNGIDGHAAPSDDEEGDVTPIDDQLVIRVNHEKCLVALRNRELVDLAKQKTGKTTSLVYAEVLKRVGLSIRRCHDPLEESEDESEINFANGPTVSTLELASSLPSTVDFTADIAPSVQPQSSSNINEAPEKRRRPSAEGEMDLDDGDSEEEESPEDDEPEMDEDYVNKRALSSARRKRMHQIRLHLLLLTETSPPLLVQTGTRGLGEFAVPFPPLIKQIRLIELENLILSRFGACALRLTRILAERGNKLDEKTISNLALVKQKEIRVTLTAMHEAGFLELQEVPRDNSRAPSRTIYLWYYDPERARLMVLEDTYKCMARILQRAKSEREVRRGLLEKAERSDVKGNEEMFLSKRERAALKEWEEKEEKLLVQLGRLERLVGVMRDF